MLTFFTSLLPQTTSAQAFEHKVENNVVINTDDKKNPFTKDILIPNDPTDPLQQHFIKDQFKEAYEEAIEDLLYNPDPATASFQTALKGIKDYGLTPRPGAKLVLAEAIKRGEKGFKASEENRQLGSQMEMELAEKLINIEVLRVGVSLIKSGEISKGQEVIKQAVSLVNQKEMMITYIKLVAFYHKYGSDGKSTLEPDTEKALATLRKKADSGSGEAAFRFAIGYWLNEKDKYDSDSKTPFYYLLMATNQLDTFTKEERKLLQTFMKILKKVVEEDENFSSQELENYVKLAKEGELDKVKKEIFAKKLKQAQKYGKKIEKKKKKNLIGLTKRRYQTFFTVKIPNLNLSE